MILPDHLRTANGILTLVGLGKFPESKAAAAVLAVHLANLPPEPEMWGATPEPMSSEDHMREAVLSACRVVKAVGWVPDAMTVAILATAKVGSAYAAWTRTAAAPEATDADGKRIERTVWVTVKLDTSEIDRLREMTIEELRDLAGVATVATEEPDHTTTPGDDGGEPEPTIDGTAEAAQAAEPEAVTAPAPETSGGGPSTVEDPPITSAEGEALMRLGYRVADVNEMPPAKARAILASPLAADPSLARWLEDNRAETLTTTPPIVGHIVDVVSAEDPDFSPTGRGGVAAGDPFLAAGVEPAQEKPRKPRCPLTYEGIDGAAVPCGRPVEHKGACGPAKVVGKAKAAPADEAP